MKIRIRLLPQYQYTMALVVPMRPNRKSLRARFLTTKFTYLNRPVSLFALEAYNTNPLPETLINPAITLKATDR